MQITADGSYRCCLLMYSTACTTYGTYTTSFRCKVNSIGQTYLNERTNQKCLLLHSANSHDRVKAHQVHTLALQNAKRSKQLLGARWNNYHAHSIYCTVALISAAVLQATPVKFETIFKWMKKCNCNSKYLLCMRHCIQHGWLVNQHDRSKSEFNLEIFDFTSIYSKNDKRSTQTNAKRNGIWKSTFKISYGISMNQFQKSSPIFNLQDQWLNRLHINRNSGNKNSSNGKNSPLALASSSHYHG